MMKDGAWATNKPKPYRNQLTNSKTHKLFKLIYMGDKSRLTPHFRQNLICLVKSEVFDQDIHLSDILIHVRRKGA